MITVSSKINEGKFPLEFAKLSFPVVIEVKFLTGLDVSSRMEDNNSFFVEGHSPWDNICWLLWVIDEASFVSEDAWVHTLVFTEFESVEEVVFN